MSNKFNLDEFEEFLGDDDSDGHRLAEFLKKKNGNVRNPLRFIDFEFEPVALSNGIVKVKPLSEKDVQTEDLPQSIPTELPHTTSENETNQTKEKRTEPSTQANQNNFPNTEHIIRSKSKSPTKNPLLENIRSSVHKSGGVSKNDQLRRYTFKRLSTVKGSGRSLMTEFEKTVSNNSDFLPKICSTPLTQNVPFDVHSPSKAQEQPQPQPQSQSQQPLVQSLEKPTEKSCTSKVNHPPEHKSSEVRESILSVWNVLKEISQERLSNKISTSRTRSSTNENSPGRTYTIEKRQGSNQIILTPVKEQHHSNENGKKSPENCNRQQKIYVKDFDTLISPTKKSKYSTFDINPCLNLVDNEEDMILDTQQSASNTPTKNKSNAGNAQMSVFIPETQEQEPITITGFENLQNLPQNLIDSLPINKTNPVIVIPIQQSINATPEKTVASKPLKSKKTKQMKEINKVQNEKNIEKNSTEMQLNQNEKCSEIETVNNLQLADILTDDEDEENILNSNKNSNCNDINDDSNNITNFQNSVVPLNLVSTLAKNRKNVKKATNKRRLQLNDSKSRFSKYMLPLGPRPAHVLNLDCKTHSNQSERKSVIKMPLNGVPCNPINGEKFAAELKTLLTGLTNREILDLRKRNSCGKIFQLKGVDSDVRKSLIDKQGKLEKEIYLEMRKRNIKNDTKTNETSMATTNTNENLVIETNKRSRSKIIDIQRMLLKQKLDNEKQTSSSTVSTDLISSPAEEIISTPIDVDIASTNERILVEHLPPAPEAFQDVRKMVEAAELALAAFQINGKPVEEVTVAPMKTVVGEFASRFSSTKLIGDEETVSFAIPDPPNHLIKKKKKTNFIRRTRKIYRS